MQFLILPILFLAAAAATPADVTFEQAQALASKDSATLSGDQVATFAESQSKGTHAARAKCPDPVKKADREPFIIVMQLDADGKVTRTWLKGNTPAATCFNEVMSHQTFMKPPHAPFYWSYDMYWQD